MSPVIATLMLLVAAIVLSAGLWTWAGTFRAEGDVPTVAFDARERESAGYERNLTVIASPGAVKWGDLRVTLDGAPLAFTATAPPGDGEWAAWSGTALRSADDLVRSGDRLEIDGAGPLAGARVDVVHAEANRVTWTGSLP